MSSINNITEMVELESLEEQEPSQKDPKLELLRKLVNDCYLEKTKISQDLTIHKKVADDVPWCPRTFDGFLCWSAVPPASSAAQACPSFITGFDPKRYAIKKCTDNGTWFTHPVSNKIWTNYTTCIDLEDLNVAGGACISVVIVCMKGMVAGKYKFRSVINDIYTYGYAMSAAALLVSLLIFVYFFRVLKCTRVRIHIQLFTSMILNNIMWIIWFKAVVNNAEVVQENKVWCQILHLITHYLMMSNYMWMFCEGLFLHIALVIVFVEETVAMHWFLTIGWIVPVLNTTIYAYVRYRTPGATERCWLDESSTSWIFSVPVIISLLASFVRLCGLTVSMNMLLPRLSPVFLVNVVRVMLVKMRRTPTQPEATKKAVRATLILIPLFGLHFVLIPFHPAPGTEGELVYEVFSCLLTSLQGVCVAVLYCFTNNDVVATIKARFARRTRPNDGIAMTGATGGESIMNTRDNIA